MAARRIGRALLGAALGMLLVGGAAARAGGGPENVFVVVNSASWASLSVANHFIQLRHIPPSNVGYIYWTGGCDGMDGQAFREKILIPTMQKIERRGLMPQIDYIVYSSDFPYNVDLTSDFASLKLPDQMRPGCSLNSATYLWHLVGARSPQCMDLRINHYMRLSPTRNPAESLPSHGFRSWYGWGVGGELMESGGQPYMLSTMLAVTSGRGNSVDEAIAYLRASASADGTQPAKTIYYSKTDDVRSKVRLAGFEAAVEDLKALGVTGQIVAQAVPWARPDVQGAMIGVAEYNWGKSKSIIRPGAIAEDFTSFGGIMSEGSSQTPLSEMLRYGAAGSSGTIVEPFAIAEKFPSPQIHVHYARGCTLAEAYYQSVFSPAQLLIVGDPLCRPWADIPQVRVSGVQAGAKVSGTVVLKAQARTPKGAEIDRFELYVDGRRAAVAAVDEPIAWDSTAEPDGYHELRVVAIAAGPIETQGRAIVPVTLDNHSRAIVAAAQPAGKVRWDQALKVRAKAPGMQRIFIVSNGIELGRIDGEEGEATINPRQLGLGPVTLSAVGMADKPQPARVFSAPIALVVEGPKPLPAIKDVPAKLSPGLALKLPNDKVEVVQSTRDVTWLATAGLGPDQAFLVQGFFDVGSEQVYQFQLWHRGDLKLSVDGVALYSKTGGDYTQKFLPVALAKGMHRLTMTGKTASNSDCRILIGGPGAQSLDGHMFRHAR